MVAFKRFDPDPDITDPTDDYWGTGTWTYDDGTSTYGQGDRDEALNLWQPPDTRLAENTTADAPMGPPEAPVPGQEALNANDPQSDVSPPPLLARPTESDQPPTDLGGTSLPEQPPARTMLPSAPGIPTGLRPAVAEMRGMPLSPEQIQERQQGVYDRTMTDVAGVQNAAAERQRGRQEALQAVTQHHEQFKTDQLARVKREGEIRAEAEQNIQTALAAQPDPGRVIKNMSTGQMVLGAVAMAIGTLGNAMAIRRGMKTVNPAAWLEKAIEDDLQDQKQSKQSRIAHWTRIFGDAEMGERAARSELNTAVGNYMQYQAQQKVTDADIQAQAMQDAAGLIGKGQQEAQALVDKENERLTIRYQPPTPKGAGDAIESFQKKLAARKAFEEAGASPEQLAGFDAAMGIPSPSGESTRQQKTREDKEKLAREEQTMTVDEAKAEAGWETVKQLGQTSGLARDPNTGKWSVPESAGGFGWKLGKMTELRAARESAIDGLARMQTGAAISESEEARFAKLLGNEEASLEEIAINLNAIDALIQSRRKQSKAAADRSGAPDRWR